MTKALGALIRRKRQEKGWSQSQLAREVGTTQVTVSNWEAGSNEPRNLAKVRRVLGITAADYQVVLITEQRRDPVVASLSATTNISAADRDALLTLYRTAVKAHRANDES